MIDETFFKSRLHFHVFIKSTINNPIFLTMDNHVTNLDYPAVTFAKENGIVLLTFPQHCSHALQPLDVCVFSPFKRALGVSHNGWLPIPAKK